MKTTPHIGQAERNLPPSCPLYLARPTGSHPSPTPKQARRPWKAGRRERLPYAI
ncbi:MAG: hypothetical protein KME26_21845 [Oscillatoria princeps RMCB-10]|nr:hypothetical protein [Oscillatoria princeps RMCB-10]